MTADEVRELGQRVLAGAAYIKPDTPDSIVEKWIAMLGGFGKALFALPEDEREGIRLWYIKALEEVQGGV